MDFQRAPLEPAPAPSALSDSFAAAALGMTIFLACIAGTLSRPVEFLASFWPANALMLGLFMRRPGLARDPKAWVASACAFVFSSLLMGDSAAAAIWLSFANLAGVVAGWQFFHGIDRNTVLLRGTRSALFLLCGCIVQAAGESIVGFPATSFLFGGTSFSAFFMWFSSALMCSMLILPIVLSAPTLGQVRQFSLQECVARFKLVHLAPLLALIACETVAMLLGGPGSLVFGVPALIWCALRYSLFSVSLLCLAVGVLKSYTATLGLITYTPDHLVDAISLRVGITLLSLGPLAVASFQSVRNELLHKLHHAARHDALTGVLGRNTFIEQCAHWLQTLGLEQHSAAVLMIDLDNFKGVNDTHGHAAGDELLREFTRLVMLHLRPSDLLGRMGGEEFALMLPNVSREEAREVAERLCDATRRHVFTFNDEVPLHVTVSIGVVHQDAPPRHAMIEQLLREADHALYQAKGTGRNRVVMSAHAVY
ncbi:GGDEF domain-containing protein [Diaphorobacter aerolatus]|uniref:diguanylate cyclase n=1 Tax=Diaphorobacter aerolatus TaxID=1288495 RepID=A0A7H0GH84_9BURK|nr:GGDEF domain-containing protein [Diaphorobacter aerolatus]QNP47650.1 diguanylate cyclase [Diaphorobacter aerolatus]